MFLDGGIHTPKLQQEGHFLISWLGAEFKKFPKPIYPKYKYVKSPGCDGISVVVRGFREEYVTHVYKKEKKHKVCLPATCIKM